MKSKIKVTVKKALSFGAIAVVVAIGYEVAIHENMGSPHPEKTTVEKISMSPDAYAQSLDRGFADLVKRVVPGVVNISTFARPRAQPGYNGAYGGAQNELFQRFFEEFFGGRMPGPRGAPRGGNDDEDGQGAGQGRAVRGKSVPVALGTGFIISAEEGLIVTNNHVIQGADEVKIQFKEDETDLSAADIIGRDPELDVALLKVKTKRKLVAIPMGDSDAIDVGEYVLAIGNPLGYGHTVSHGILSAKGRKNPEFRMGRYLQTDASINPGNSGGPLINTKAEVIGINNAIDARGQGIGFAIPINLVKNVITQLKTKGSVSRGYLGVSAADLTPELAEQLGISATLQGVVVSDVGEGTPADAAGMKPYDVITHVNGEPVVTAQDLTIKIMGIPVGQTAKVDIMRAGKPRTLDVKVAERPGVGGMTPKRRHGVSPREEEEQSGVNFAEWGFHADNVTAQNARAYRIPSEWLQGKKGVVVADVDFGKPAANSGLNPGDLILDVTVEKDGKKTVEIHSTADLEKALKSVKGKSVMIRVKRFDQVGNEFVSVVVLSK